jgi:hypothetical protein
VHALVDARRPFLVLSGHFAQSTVLAVLNGALANLGGLDVNSAVPPPRFSPHVLRRRLQNKQFYGLSRFLAGEAAPTEVLPHIGDDDAGAAIAGAAILEILSKPGRGALMLIDAWWERPGAHRRPFAGRADTGFALGAARLARYAQCPIVFYCAVQLGNGRVRIEWQPPIEPPALADEASDLRIMDHLLDELERAVGRYPLHYLDWIGAERRWNAESNRWEQLAAAPEAESTRHPFAEQV